MNTEKITNNKKDSIISKFGLFSFLIGVLFWIYVAFWFLDTYYLEGTFWNALGRILDDNAGEQWMTVIVVFFIYPTVTHFMGLLFGFIGLVRLPRKLAIFGLLINSILPILLMANWIYRLIFGYPEVVIPN